MSGVWVLAVRLLAEDWLPIARLTPPPCRAPAALPKRQQAPARLFALEKSGFGSGSKRDNLRAMCAQSAKSEGYSQSCCSGVVACDHRGGYLRLSRTAALLLLASFPACTDRASTAEAKNPQQAPAAETKMTPDDLRKQFDREAAPVPKHPVSAGDAWSAYLESKSAPTIEREENFWLIKADLDWDAELNCFVYDGAIDAGGASNTMIRSAKESVEFRQLAAYSLTHHKLDPMLSLRGIYQVEQDGALAAGDYKLMVMPRSKYSVLCFHDAPGYAKSFERVTTDFARSIDYQNDSPDPVRGELWTVTLDGMAVGFAQNKTYELDNGNVQRVALSAQFLPTAPGELSFEDRVSIVTSDKKGELQTGKYLTIENGEPSLTLDIQRGKKGYEYQGTIQDKEVRGTFKSKKPLLGDFAFEKRLKGLSAKPKKLSFEQWEYSPSADPSVASKVSYDVIPSGKGLNVTVGMGKRGYTLFTNSRGVPQRLIFPTGSKKIEAELVEEIGVL